MGTYSGRDTKRWYYYEVLTRINFKYHHTTGKLSFSFESITVPEEDSNYLHKAWRKMERMYEKTIKSIKSRMNLENLGVDGERFLEEEIWSLLRREIIDYGILSSCIPSDLGKIKLREETYYSQKSDGRTVEEKTRARLRIANK